MAEQAKLIPEEQVKSRTADRWHGDRRQFLVRTAQAGVGLIGLGILDACNKILPSKATPTAMPSATPPPPPTDLPAATAMPTKQAVYPTETAAPAIAPTKETIPQNTGRITVNREKGEFESNGKRLRAVGFNRYDLLTLSPHDQEAIFANTQAMGGKILRFWCPASLTDSGNDTTKLRSLVALAEKNHMYLYPVFIDQWGTYNNQKQLGADWYQNGYKTDGYRDYVKRMAAAFAGVPQIGIWELVNEPQTGSAADLRAFAQDMHGVIQTVDPNRPVSLGTIGTGQAGAQQEDWLEDTLAVNVASMHDDKNTTVTTDFGGQDNNFQTRLQQAKKNGLPMVIGELGIDADCKGGDPCLNPQDRAKAVAVKLHTYFNSGADMVLGWSVGLRDFGYDFTPSDPAAAVWLQFAQQLQNQ